MLCFTPCSRDLDSDRLCVEKRGKRWVEREMEIQRDSKLRIQWKSASRSLITLSSCDLTLSRMLSRALLSQRQKRGEGLVKKWIKRIFKKTASSTDQDSKSDRESQRNNLPPSPSIFFPTCPPFLQEKLEDNPLPLLWGLVLREETDSLVSE